MSANYAKIQELLQQRTDYQARLNLMPYDGNPEIKEQSGGKYLYGMGFIVIPEKEVSEFKKLLIAFYEGETIEILRKFMKERCWKNF